MYIENCQDVISACRFCFMCRHLDPVGNVTFRESDTPRGRALIIDRMRMDRACMKNPDFIDALYRSALSAANRTHCVSHYDEIGLVLAARREIVEAGLAPANVETLAKELMRAKFIVKGKGDVLYYGAFPALYPKCKTLTGKDPGKALEVLGFINEANTVFEAFKKAVADSKCKTLIVAEPSAYDFLKDKLADVEVVHCTEHLLAARINARRTRKAVYLESDYLRNYDGNPSAPRKLLANCGYTLAPFGTNSEESYAVGEGAVVYDDLNPGLCEKLCSRVYRLAGNSKKTLFITASLYVRDTLRKHNPKIEVVSIEEAVSPFVAVN